ncbi:MAG: tetratricopeptide repeat protein, partial [Chthoniobacterales bacterium]
PPGLRAGQKAMLADSITGAEAAVGRPLMRSEVSAFWSAKAKAYIAENPATWLRLLGRKIANFWNGFQYDDLSIVTNLREQGVTFPGISFGLAAALALPGMILAAISIPSSRWILAAILLHMFSLLSVFVTERYRLAAVPGLLLFAAFGLGELWRYSAAGRHQRALLYLALLAAGAWSVSLQRGDAELWALEPYNSGIQALEAGHLAVAERKLKLAHAYVPGNTEVNFALGNLELARGNRAAARDSYVQTLRMNARHEGALNNLGVLALDDGQWNVARGLFETALSINPNNAKSHFLQARALEGMGQREQALAEIEIALKLQPAQPEFATLREQLLAGTPRAGEE